MHKFYVYNSIFPKVNKHMVTTLLRACLLLGKLCFFSDSSHGQFSLAPGKGVPKQGVMVSFPDMIFPDRLALSGLDCTGWFTKLDMPGPSQAKLLCASHNAIGSSPCRMVRKTGWPWMPLRMATAIWPGADVRLQAIACQNPLLTALLGHWGRGILNGAAAAAAGLRGTPTAVRGPFYKLARKGLNPPAPG